MIGWEVRKEFKIFLMTLMNKKKSDERRNLHWSTFCLLRELYEVGFISINWSFSWNKLYLKWSFVIKQTIKHWSFAFFLFYPIQKASNIQDISLILQNWWIKKQWMLQNQLILFFNELVQNKFMHSCNCTT